VRGGGIVRILSGLSVSLRAWMRRLDEGKSGSWPVYVDRSDWTRCLARLCMRALSPGLARRDGFGLACSEQSRRLASLSSSS
jgi:hypothetical protein